MSSKLLFKYLLNNVTRNSVFSFNDKLYRQVDGCRMGNPLSPVLANIFMAKLERDVVQPFDPPFYDRYVDDCFLKKTKNIPDELLDTAFDYSNNQFNCKVYEKPGKFRTKWKRNCITVALHRSKRISTDMKSEIQNISKKFTKAAHPKNFISSTFNSFVSKQVQEEKLIPEYLFD